jgi:cytoskeletal protein RodZ
MKKEFASQSGIIPLIGLVILLAVAIIAAGSIYYISKYQTATVATEMAINSDASNRNANPNTNTPVNKNTNLNTDTVVNLNANANSAANTNSTANLNAATGTNTTVGTTGWKTYADSEYGFSFRYPAELTASNNSSRQYQAHAFSLASASASGIPKKSDRAGSVSYYDYTFDPDNLKGLYEQFTRDNTTPVTVDGRTGYLYFESNSGTRVLHIQVAAKNGNILVFEFSGGEYGDYNPWYYDAAERATFVSTIRID